jgi:hypothetical protein
MRAGQCSASAGGSGSGRSVADSRKTPSLLRTVKCWSAWESNPMQSGQKSRRKKASGQKKVIEQNWIAHLGLVLKK